MDVFIDDCQDQEGSQESKKKWMDDLACVCLKMRSWLACVMSYMTDLAAGWNTNTVDSLSEEWRVTFSF